LQSEGRADQSWEVDYIMNVAGAVTWRNNLFENVNVNLDPDRLDQGYPRYTLTLPSRPTITSFAAGVVSSSTDSGLGGHWC